MQADILIIGSGTAGATIAKELAAKGKKEMPYVGSNIFYKIA